MDVVQVGPEPSGWFKGPGDGELMLLGESVDRPGSVVVLFPQDRLKELHFFRCE
jgi:hypothetical protein